MDKRSLQQAILIALVLVGVLILSIPLIMWLTEDSFGESTRIAQTFITAVAILIAAVFALFKLRIFRDLAPHLTVSQKVSHRPVGESYIHMDVSVTLRNNSRVKIELRRGFFALQKIAPVEDEEVEHLYTQAFVDAEDREILWTTLSNVDRRWKKNTLVIEPGESHQEVCEFIVTNSVKSVLIYAYFYNPYSSMPEGWQSTTIHDIP